MVATWLPVYVHAFRVDDNLKAVVYLPTNVRQVSGIQLMGYKLRDLGVECPAVALTIDEISDSRSVTTNLSESSHGHAYPSRANGAFAICHHDERPAANGGQTGFLYDGYGLACTHFTPRKIAKLTFNVEPLYEIPGSTPLSLIPTSMAQFWLRILVECD